MIRKIAAATLLVASTYAQADTVKEGAVACVSEQKFDQMMQAVVDSDERGIRYMLENGCIVTNGRYEVSVLDRTWTGKVKVRAYAGNDALVLWTNMENVN